MYFIVVVSTNDLKTKISKYVAKIHVCFGISL